MEGEFRSDAHSAFAFRPRPVRWGMEHTANRFRTIERRRRRLQVQEEFLADDDKVDLLCQGEEANTISTISE